MQFGGHIGHFKDGAGRLRLHGRNGRALVDDVVSEQARVKQLHGHDGTHGLGAGFARLVDFEHIGNAGHGQVGVQVFHAAGGHQDQPAHIVRVRQRIAQGDGAAQRVT